MYLPKRYNYFFVPYAVHNAPLTRHQEAGSGTEATQLKLKEDGKVCLAALVDGLALLHRFYPITFLARYD